MTKKNTLDRVYLKKPCSTEWSLMEGNEQIRSCSECSKLVYNLSSMTRKQAEDLIANAGGDICAKFERNDRGKIVTADQAIHSPFFRMRLPLFTKAAVSALLGIGITAQAEVRINSYDIVSTSMARSLKDTTEKTLTQDGKPAIGGSIFDAKKAVIAGATVTRKRQEPTEAHRNHI